MIYDQGSNSGQNINLIAQNSVPKESIWAIGFLKELINLCDGNLSVGSLNDDESSKKLMEIKHFINIVATQ